MLVSIDNPNSTGNESDQKDVNNNLIYQTEFDGYNPPRFRVVDKSKKVPEKINFKATDMLFPVNWKVDVE